MTLATHAVVGTLAASLFPNEPAVAFGAAFVSHFVIDAVPHWDYRLAALERDPKNPLNDNVIFDRRFIGDLGRIGLDIALGILLSAGILVLSGKSAYPLAALGAAGGILPDALQVAYAKCRREPLVSLQKFHLWIQKGRQLRVSPLTGIALQSALIAVLIAAELFFRP